MDNEDEILKELEEIWYVLLNAKNAYYYAEYMFSPPTEKEQGYMRHYGVEMVFLRKILWRNSIIEIANLFTNKQKRSIQKFLNKLDKGGVYHGCIQLERIHELKTKLSSFGEIVEKVQLMRDKVFAHADYEYEKAKEYDKIDKDVEKLIQFTEDFISEIYLEFDVGAIHDSGFLRGDFKILEILADFENEKYNKIIDDFKSRL